MKVRYFKFKKGQFWDGDEAIIDYIMNSLGIDLREGAIVKRDITITVIINKDKRK